MQLLNWTHGSVSSIVLLDKMKFTTKSKGEKYFEKKFKHVVVPFFVNASSFDQPKNSTSCLFWLNAFQQVKVISKTEISLVDHASILVATSLKLLHEHSSTGGLPAIFNWNSFLLFWLHFVNPPVKSIMELGYSATEKWNLVTSFDFIKMQVESRSWWGTMHLRCLSKAICMHVSSNQLFCSWSFPSLLTQHHWCTLFSPPPSENSWESLNCGPADQLTSVHWCWYCNQKSCSKNEKWRKNVANWWMQAGLCQSVLNTGTCTHCAWWSVCCVNQVMDFYDDKILALHGCWCIQPRKHRLICGVCSMQMSEVNQVKDWEMQTHKGKTDKQTTNRGRKKNQKMPDHVCFRHKCFVALCLHCQKWAPWFPHSAWLHVAILSMAKHHGNNLCIFKCLFLRCSIWSDWKNWHVWKVFRLFKTLLQKWMLCLTRPTFEIGIFLCFLWWNALQGKLFLLAGHMIFLLLVGCFH